MGRLRRAGAPDFRELAAETSVGRAAGAGLRLSQSHVSMQHASLRWTERGTWELRDLQSKNGTFVNGQRIAAGTPVRLELGAELTFGASTDRWVLEDVSPPRPMLIRADGAGPPIFLRDTLVGLPSLEEPTVSLFRGENGNWYIDSRDRAGQLSDGDLIAIGAEHYRCCLPTTPDETELVGGIGGLCNLADVELELEVSSDEALVSLTLHCNGRDVHLGQKACHCLLLALARCRLGRDLSTTESIEDGWIGVNALLAMLNVTEQRLNVDIFRIRQALKTAGVLDAVGLIERDTQQRRVRLGTSRVVLPAVAARAASGSKPPD